MKNLIIVAALLASTSVSAFKVNHAHKDWTWSSEMNDHGAFITSTMAKEKIDGKHTGMFMFVAIPEGGKCDLFYSTYHFSKKHDEDITGETETFKDIPVYYRIDKKQAWEDKTAITVSIEDIYTVLTYKSQGYSNGKFVTEMLKGTKLHVASNNVNDPITENTFSLMGSSVAMKAIYNRCMDHLEVFPDYNASKDSRAAMKGKIEQQRLQVVADKAESI